MNYWETEVAQVRSYEESTGLLNLDKPLKYYYWGSAKHPESDSLDIRGEVMLLSRPIQISLCQVVLSGNSSTHLINVQLTGTPCHTSR